jgi:hypothetical protein
MGNEEAIEPPSRRGAKAGKYAKKTVGFENSAPQFFPRILGVFSDLGASAPWRLTPLP